MECKFSYSRSGYVFVHITSNKWSMHHFKKFSSYRFCESLNAEPNGLSARTFCGKTRRGTPSHLYAPTYVDTTDPSSRTPFHTDHNDSFSRPCVFLCECLSYWSWRIFSDSTCIRRGVPTCVSLWYVW